MVAVRLFCAKDRSKKMRRRKSQEGEEIWERILLAVLAQQPGGPILNFRDAKSLTARPLA